MTKWKLCRQTFSSEEFKFVEGDEITVGRGLNNTITLTSLVVSRHHCIINAKKDEVLITDLKSSNGIYVGAKKIPPNIPFSLTDADIIGIGWTMGVSGQVNDSEKFVYKLVKEKSSVTDRLHFQNENWLDLCEANIISKASKNETIISDKVSPILSCSRPLKRKTSTETYISSKTKKSSPLSINRNNLKIENDLEKVNHNAFEIIDCPNKVPKTEIEDYEYEAFNIKQEEYLSNEEPILIDSDSDIESEQWLSRLSQSSPAKPPSSIDMQVNAFVDSSYSQLEDVTFNEVQNNDTDEEMLNDLVIILPPPDNNSYEKSVKALNAETVNNCIKEVDKESNLLAKSKSIDTVDGGNYGPTNLMKNQNKSLDDVLQSVESGKKIQIIEPHIVPERRKSRIIQESKPKSSHSKSKKKIPCAIVITNSLKEERKKKLKEIASKDKEELDKEDLDQLNNKNSNNDNNKNSNNDTNKPVVNAKITTSNRGAFLTDLAPATIKPTKRKNETKSSTSKKESRPHHKKQTEKDKDKIDVATVKPTKRNDGKKDPTLISNKESKTHQTKHIEKDKHEIEKNTDKGLKSRHRSRSSSRKSIQSETSAVRDRVNSNSSADLFPGKLVSMVGPIPRKPPKKTVRFSDTPQIREFEIEPGNRLNKTSSVKTRLLDRVQQKPKFSREKIALMTILKWNPLWLHEQTIYPTPPPILAHNNPPMAIFHSFNSHSQYVQLVGDLLLMEIWEYLTQGYNKTKKQMNKRLPLRIEYLPPAPVEERYFELFNINVKIASPNPDAKHLPRVGEILMVEFGPENKRLLRFFFVHNVRQVPAPLNKNVSIFSISLYTTFTESMKCLKPGDLLLGTILAFINNELMLFEAMEYLAESPLSEAILRPHPMHFPKLNNNNGLNMNSQVMKQISYPVLELTKSLTKQ